jgi:hypothetical protein
VTVKLELFGENDPVPEVSQRYEDELDAVAV